MFETIRNFRREHPEGCQIVGDFIEEFQSSVMAVGAFVGILDSKRNRIADHYSRRRILVAMSIGIIGGALLRTIERKWDRDALK